ncbi:MAG: phage antirepressor KilAC domain-containing protein, partial [Bacteroidetes bacterium]|nr:phage antirepressor KilAC domain-containing protein [Bacteroidota bacterium]
MQKELEKQVLDLLKQNQELIAKLSEDNEKKDVIIEEQHPKVEVYEHLISNGNCENATDLFKKIKLLKKGKEVGRNMAYKFLRNIGILRNNNTPYIEFARYFKVNTTYDKRGYSHNVPLFTVEGVAFFIKKINEYGEAYNLKIEYR